MGEWKKMNLHDTLIDIESENQQFIESMGFEKKGLLRYENDKDILSMWMIL